MESENVADQIGQLLDGSQYLRISQNCMKVNRLMRFANSGELPDLHEQQRHFLELGASELCYRGVVSACAPFSNSANMDRRLLVSGDLPSSSFQQLLPLAVDFHRKR
jgi:hypothetical protein